MNKSDNRHNSATLSYIPHLWLAILFIALAIRAMQGVFDFTDFVMIQTAGHFPQHCCAKAS